MSTKRKRISSRLLPIKALGLSGVLLVVPLIILLNKDVSILEKLLSSLAGLTVFGLLSLWAFTRSRIEIDDSCVYIINWNAKTEKTIPFTKISAFLITALHVSTNVTWPSSRRIIYNLGGKEDKQFWLHPALGINVLEIKKEIKKANPELLESKVSMIPFEHIIFKSKDWYK
jgi:hypothetical protein